MARIVRSSVGWVVMTAVSVIVTVTSVGAVAHAASGPVQTSPLSAASGVVASCDPSGAWTYAFSKDANGRVASVQVSSISSTCAGGTLLLTLVGPGSPVSGSPVALTGCTSTCSATVSFPTSPPFPSDVTSARAVIAGP